MGISYHSGWFGSHIDCGCSCSCRENVTITDVIIKTLVRKCDRGCEWRHTRKRWAGILGYFEKSSLLRFEPRRDQLGLGGAPRVVGSDGTVRIVKIVCLSLSSCRKPKSQEGNKSFVPEPRESSVFRDSYASECLTHPYICILYSSHIHILILFRWICYKYTVLRY